MSKFFNENTNDSKVGEAGMPMACAKENQREQKKQEDWEYSRMGTIARMMEEEIESVELKIYQLSKKLNIGVSALKSVLPKDIPSQVVGQLGQIWEMASSYPGLGNKLEAFVICVICCNHMDRKHWYAPVLGFVQKFLDDDQTLVSVALRECKKICGASLEEVVEQQLDFSDFVGVFTSDEESDSADDGKASRYGIKELKKDLNAVRRSKVVAKFQKWIAVLVAMGIAKLKGFPFKMGNVRLIHQTIEKKDANMATLVESTFEMLKSAIAVGSGLWKGEGMTVFKSDNELAQFDEDFAVLHGKFKLFEAGKLEDLGMTMSEYLRSADLIYEKACELRRTATGSVGAYLAAKMLESAKMRTKIAGGMRRSLRLKPFCLLLYGKPGSGKTVLSPEILKYILKVNDYPSTDDFIVSMSDQDKFFSEILEHHTGVTLDDLAQARVEQSEANPCLLFLKLANNEDTVAPKAEAHMKGQVHIQPKAIVGTTNVADLQASEYSVDPEAIHRRWDMKVEILPREEFCTDGKLDIQKIEEAGPIRSFAEVCTASVFELKPVNKTTKTVFQREYVKVDGKELVKLSIADLLLLVKDRSQKHFASQQRLVEVRLKNNVLSLDPETGLPMSVVEERERRSKEKLQEMRQREAENLEVFTRSFQRGVRVRRGQTLETVEEKIRERVLEETLEEEDDMEEQLSWDGLPTLPRITVQQSVEHVLRFENMFFSSWFTWYDTLYSTRYGLRLFDMLSLISIVRQFSYLLGIDFIALMVMWRYATMGVVIIFLTWNCLAFVTMVSAYRMWYFTTYAHNPITSRLVAIQRRTKRMMIDYQYPLLMLAGTICTGWAAWWMVQKRKKHPCVQLGQKMTPMRDDYTRENRYDTPDISSVIVSPRLRSSTHEELLNKIQRNISEVTFYKRNTQQFTGLHGRMLALGGNVWLVPNHFIRPDLRHDVVIKSPRQSPFRVVWDGEYAVRIENTDMAVLWLPSGGPRTDLTYAFADCVPVRDLEVYVSQVKEGVVTTSEPLKATPAIITPKKCDVTYESYKYSIANGSGMCGSVVTGRGPSPFIVGLHLAGNQENGFGYCGKLTQGKLQDALQKLDKIPGVCRAVASSPLCTMQMGKEFGPLREAHQKACVRQLDDDAKFKFFGDHSLGRSHYSSVVITSVISDKVSKIMNLDKVHGPPQDMKNKKHWMRNMEMRTDTVWGFRNDVLKRAYVDYQNQIVRAVQPLLAKQVFKIGDDENACGVDGVVGINAVNFKTSMGFPLSKKKELYVQDSQRERDDISALRDVDQEVWDLVEEMESELLAGKRCNTIFRGSLKDEPTKIGKDKVRVFQACSFAFSLLVRRYFLMLSKLVQENTESFECAVGLNCESPEWTQLMDYVLKYGKERVIAGDYKAFDSKMSPQVMLMSFKVLINLAQMSGNYDEDDLQVMRGIATEICYPICEYDGSLIEFWGSNPSGHPLTVIINGMTNSIYMRYAYFVIYPKTKDPFAKVMALITYGDDNYGSVNRRYAQFTHTRIAEEFAKVGIEYTMADKEAQSQAYVHAEQTGFLKRKPIWDDDLGEYRAPVDENSIQKMLHCHMKSKVLTENESAMEAIENAARAYFQYPREEHERRRVQLEQVIDECNLRHLRREPLPTYDERLQEYLHKYRLGQA
ncbi:predicted replication-associated polyprotein [Delisea pulchra RNA virus]|nr:predicted replication-associated polyprotein [Delisea pulchra RNA virus]AMB17481.1 predicted replication-associated polyprotein [Delisea pulchra RNA virus]